MIKRARKVEIGSASIEEIRKAKRLKIGKVVFKRVTGDGEADGHFEVVDGDLRVQVAFRVSDPPMAQVNVDHKYGIGDTEYTSSSSERVPLADVRKTLAKVLCDDIATISAELPRIGVGSELFTAGLDIMTKLARMRNNMEDHQCLASLFN